MAKAAKSKEVAVQSDRLKRLQSYAKAAKSGGSSIIGKLLKFTKGEWFAGQDEDEVPLKTKLVLNTDSVLVGWTRWEDGKPVEQDMGPVVEGFQPKQRSELGFTDQSEWEEDNDGKRRDPWSFGNQILLRSVGKKPELYTFTVGSKGGLNAVGDVLDAYTEECVERGEDDYPVVSLDRDFYMHPTYKKVWIPRFEIVGWAPINAKDWVPNAANVEEEDSPARKVTAGKGAKKKQLSY